MVSGSFFAGYLLAPNPEKGALIVQNIPEEALKIGDNSAINTPQNGPKQVLGAFFGSRDGKKYYPLTCPEATKISEDKKVWFISKEEAESAGYQPSKTCF